MKKKVFLLMLLVFCLAIDTGNSWAEVGNGLGLGHIANDVQCDNCVDGGDIADNAVTDAKITGPISATKIQQGSGSRLDADTLDGLDSTAFAPFTVGTSNIADGAITNSKIPDNEITAAKIADGDDSGLNADMLDGLDSTEFALVNHDHDATGQTHYDNVIVVSKDGKGDFTDPLAAHNSITDASETNPYLIKIMPGEYEIPWGALRVGPHIDIEGSGRGVTKIKSVSGSIMGHPISAIYYQNRTDSNELRDITIEHTSDGGGYVWGIRAYGNGSAPRITNVDVIASGGSTMGGIYVENSASPILSDVHISIPIGGSSSTSGIQVRGAAPVLKRVEFDINGNRFVNSIVISWDSVVKGTAVQIDEGVRFGYNGGTFNCVYCYDMNYYPYL